MDSEIKYSLIALQPDEWTVKEMDDLLSSMWLNGDETQFAQIYNLILNENVPGEAHNQFKQSLYHVINSLTNQFSEL